MTQDQIASLHKLGISCSFYRGRI